jgi:hypothetical protein
MNWHRKRPAVFSGFTRAVSQLLWPHKGRFPWEKTTTGDVASVYTDCETALTEKICIANPQ